MRDLSSEVTELRNLQESSKQEWLEKTLRDQLSRLQQKFYGFGRECAPRKDRPVGHDTDQLRLHCEHHVAEGVESKNSGDPVEAAVYEFKAEELRAESVLRGLGSNDEAWKKMKDFYKESTEITITERTYMRVVHKQARYRLKDEFNTTGKEVIITAPGPVKLKAGCQYSVDFGLSVVSDKYEYHLPLERQRRRMEASGLDVEVKTLYNLCEAVAGHCESVVDGIREDIMGDFCAVHLDETPWRILGSHGSGQMWVMSNRLASYYRFEPTRSGLVAEEMLKGYTGAIVTDGFGGYNRLKKSADVRVAHCWAHARREFYERLDDFPIESEQALDLIDKIFELETKARSFDQLRELRRTEIKSVIEKYQRWLFETRPKFLPGDGISRAIDYSLKFWPELTLFLKDLTVPVDNNDAERALRHVVMGRKNFAGSKTINGADTAATLYTVIESAKKSGLQPKEYLKYLITERWHDSKPLTPQRYANKYRNAKSRVTFPSKSDWKI